MKKITTYIDGENKYYICKDKNGFWAFSEEMVDSDGKLKNQINGVNGLLSDTFKECIDRVKNICNYNKLEKKGYSESEIIKNILLEEWFK